MHSKLVDELVFQKKLKGVFIYDNSFRKSERLHRSTYG